jgi:hypothetical protein
MAFADLPKNREGPTRRFLGPHIFDRVCLEHGIEHPLTSRPNWGMSLMFRIRIEHLFMTILLDIRPNVNDNRCESLRLGLAATVYPGATMLILCDQNGPKPIFQVHQTGDDGCFHVVRLQRFAEPFRENLVSLRSSDAMLDPDAEPPQPTVILLLLIGHLSVPWLLVEELQVAMLLLLAACRTWAWLVQSE